MRERYRDGGGIQVEGGGRDGEKETEKDRKRQREQA